jgi:hypothetical protein
MEQTDLFRIDQELEAIRAHLAEQQRQLEAMGAQLTTLAALLGAQPDMPAECREHRCGYYTHYLAHGAPELTHEGYHAAEKKCDAAQRKDIAFLDAHPDHRGPTPFERMATYWEKKIRC